VTGEVSTPSSKSWTTSRPCSGRVAGQGLRRNSPGNRPRWTSRSGPSWPGLKARGRLSRPGAAAHRLRARFGKPPFRSGWK
jgi:hypothetical protein